ncbi:MBL fold metallo-hydrolase [bacterium]|nr:MAG: MBL fold metallo-hydrolase [bacterium]
MAENDSSVTLNNVKYEWLGQSGVRITSTSGFIIYIDPILLDINPPKADLVLITHHHVDHCLPEYIAAVRAEKTRIAAFKKSYLQYCVHDIKGVRTIDIDQRVELGGVNVTGMEAYASRGFHTKGEGCGFLLEMDSQRIYFSGDTSKIKEMEELKNIDAAIMPICDNTYSIATADIVEAIKMIKPKLFIPVHFTPIDEPDPVIKEPFIATKDPRFFTRKAKAEDLIPFFEGTGIEVALLKKIGKGF